MFRGFSVGHLNGCDIFKTSWTHNPGSELSPCFPRNCLTSFHETGWRTAIRAAVWKFTSCLVKRKPAVEEAKLTFSLSRKENSGNSQGLTEHSLRIFHPSPSQIHWRTSCDGYLQPWWDLATQVPTTPSPPQCQNIMIETFSVGINSPWYSS